MVTPITSSLTPRSRARLTAPLTISWAPPSRINNPAISQKTALSMDTFVGISASKSVLIGSESGDLMPSFTSQIMTTSRVASSTTPSTRLRKRSRNMQTVIKVTASSAGISRRSVADLISIGLTSATAPRTRPTFAMFEPIALPIARLDSPRNAATTETSISGAEVAQATTVSPMSSGATPRFRAVAEPPNTNRSAPRIRSTSPPIIRARSTSIKSVATSHTINKMRIPAHQPASPWRSAAGQPGDNHTQSAINIGLQCRFR